MEVRCPQCKKPFVCAGNPSCWCFETSLPPAVLEKLRLMAAECFCPECLRAAAQNMEKHDHDAS